MAVICGYCKQELSENSPKCEQCDARNRTTLLLAQMLQEAEQLQGRTPSEPPIDIEKDADIWHRPPDVPLPLLLWGGICGAITAVVAYFIQSRTGFSLILLFPFAIGVVAGFMAAYGTVTQAKIWPAIRTSYPVMAAGLGLLCYLSTFYMGYYETLKALESEGYRRIWSQVSIWDYLEVMAEQPVRLFTVKPPREVDVKKQDAKSTNYLLWLVEAGAAAFGGYWGWSKYLKTWSGEAYEEEKAKRGQPQPGG